MPTAFIISRRNVSNSGLLRGHWNHIGGNVRHLASSVSRQWQES